MKRILTAALLGAAGMALAGGGLAVAHATTSTYPPPPGGSTSSTTVTVTQPGTTTTVVSTATVTLPGTTSTVTVPGQTVTVPGPTSTVVEYRDREYACPAGTTKVAGTQLCERTVVQTVTDPAPPAETVTVERTRIVYRSKPCTCPKHLTPVWRNGRWVGCAAKGKG